MKIDPIFLQKTEDGMNIEFCNIDGNLKDTGGDGGGGFEEQVKTNGHVRNHAHHHESWRRKLVQIIIPFFISGVGMVLAGVLFDIYEGWDVFQNVREIIVLVPALIGLKGNLDMSLASRLSTQVNLGEVHDRSTIIEAVLGNVTLKLLQSIVIGFLASFVACLTAFIKDPIYRPQNILILIASSTCTAALTSIVLGLLVMSIIILCKQYKINPDNVATGVAGSLGDVGTLTTLAFVGTFFYHHRDNYWIPFWSIIVWCFLIPFLIIYSKQNKFVKSTLYHGWLPILIAMLISSLSGVVLEIAVNDYKGIATYQPAVNGVGGNLVSVYSSRLSTELNRDISTFGKWAASAPKKLLNFPYHAFFGDKNTEAKTARLLMALVVPGHLVFFFMIYFLSELDSRPTLTIWFVLFYLIVVFLQVTILFVLCYYVVHIVWRIKRNPDDYCIPLLTACGDIIGVSLLYVCFFMVHLTGNENIKYTRPTTVSPFMMNYSTYSLAPKSNFT